MGAGGWEMEMGREAAGLVPVCRSLHETPPHHCHDVFGIKAQSGGPEWMTSLS